MPQPAVPAPKPLTVRAAAYVRAVNAAEAKRQSEIQNIVSKALAAAGPVSKAKTNSDQCAVYDAAGNLVGTCDPDSITMIAAAKAPAAQRQTGDDELGGPKPAPQAGAPVQPVDDTDDMQKAIAKAAAHGRALRAQIGPNSGTPAAEQVRLAKQLDELAYAAIAATINRGRR
jgi:hypothetical protein